MFLDDLLTANRHYVGRREATPLPPPGDVSLAVVACYDPRLDRLLRPALGLEEGQGFLLRAPGALVSPTNGVLRSLALAVYLFEVREILVVGHTSCRMAQFPTNDFVAAFRRRGVAREAFGNEDLRRWAEAIADPRRGVQASIAAIAQAPFLPRDLTLAGVVLDDASGRLEVVHRPGDPVPATAPSGPSPLEIPPVPPEAADQLKPALEAVRRFLHEVGSRSALRQDLQRLRDVFSSNQSWLRKLRYLQGFADRAATDTRELRTAVEELKNHLATTGTEAPLAELGELLKTFYPTERKPR